MKFICSLSSVAIVSCLSVNSGAVMGKVAEQVSNPILPDQTEPVMVADIFRSLRDAVQTIEQVDRAIDLLDQVIRQDTATPQENQEAGEQIEQRPVEQAPVQVNNNEDSYQRLARRSNESHEAWYNRIQPMINVMPGPNYRAWKATLLPEDRETYDAITRQRNYEAAEIMNQVTPLILEGVLQDNSR